MTPIVPIIDTQGPSMTDSPTVDEYAPRAVDAPLLGRRDGCVAEVFGRVWLIRDIRSRGIYVVEHRYDPRVKIEEHHVPA